MHSSETRKRPNILTAKGNAGRRTLTLPVTARALAWAENTFYVEYEEPAPAIMGLRRIQE